MEGEGTRLSINLRRKGQPRKIWRNGRKNRRLWPILIWENLIARVQGNFWGLGGTIRTRSKTRVVGSWSECWRVRAALSTSERIGRPRWWNYKTNASRFQTTSTGSWTGCWTRPSNVPLTTPAQQEIRSNSTFCSRKSTSRRSTGDILKKLKISSRTSKRSSNPNNLTTWKLNDRIGVVFLI